MKIIRIAASCIVFGAGAITLLFGLLYTFGVGASQTVEHSKELAQTFQVAASYVTSFKQKTGRLPSNQEFETWAASFPSRPYSSPYGMRLELPPFPNDVVEQFGAPPNDAFLLTYWRGEWEEYYASWVNRTSMQLDKSAYYLLGSKFADGALLIAIALAALLGARRLWPMGRKQ